MYFDKKTQKGVVSAFRQDCCEKSTYTLRFKGVESDKYYSITDVDGVNDRRRIKGSDLMSGLTLKAENPRTAIVLYVSETK